MEQLLRIIFSPLFEFTCPSFDENSDNAFPILIQQCFGVVGHLKSDFSFAQCVFKLNPLFEANVTGSFFIGSFLQKLLNVAETEVSGMQIFRYNNDRIFLFLNYHVDPHLFFICVSSIS